MNEMNKIIGIVMLAFVAIWSGDALAKRGPQGVSYTIHNLSTSADTYWDMYVSDNEEEVCVFCHTPHSGSLDAPLWNREAPTTSYTHYNSASLSSYLQGLGVNRAVENESLLCLSCHDGSIAINSLVNYSNNTPTPTHWGGQDVSMPYIGMGIGPGGLIGSSWAGDETVHGDLSDDHPISFKYQSVVDEKGDEFKDIATAQLAGVRFFPQDGASADLRVECSSCHDPHVMYDPYYALNGTTTNAGVDESYRPFLITSNAGSALCLACHTK